MVSNFYQVQHILNGLINGAVYNGKMIDIVKLVEHKLSVIKILDIYNKL